MSQSTASVSLLRFQIGPKHAGRTVIAHLSDLHLTASTNSRRDQWLALRNDLAENRERIDLVAVTGDIIDGSVNDVFRRGTEKALKAARTFLRELCELAQVDPDAGLLVVPGNHDARTKGLVRKRAQFNQFCEIFRAEYTHRIYRKLKLCFLVFNSNTSTAGINMATGYVERNELSKVDEIVRTIRETEPEAWGDSTKIALIHHHPMPIGDTENRDGISLPEWMMLKNAGQFMSEMVRWNVDVILHGHQHCSATSKAAFPTEPERYWQVAVVAGGSVFSEAGNRQSMGLLSVRQSGAIDLEKRVRTAVSYSRGAVHPLHTYEEVRGRLWERYGERLTAQVKVKSILRTDTIAAGSGDVNITELYDGVLPRGESPVAELSRRMKGHLGYFQLPSCVSSTPYLDVRFEWRSDSHDGERDGALVFTPPLQPRTPCSFESKRVILNAIHFWQRDLQRHDRETQDIEWAQVAMREMVERLVFRLKFPSGFFPQSPRIEVSDYLGEEAPEERAFAAAHMSILAADNSILLALDRPLPGHHYRIIWRLPEEDPIDAGVPPPQKARVVDLQDRLIGMLDPAKATLQQKFQSQLADLLGLLHEEMAEVLAQPAARPADTALVFWCFDDRRRGLVCVGAAGAGAGVMTAEAIPPGRTVVGQAWRRREVVVWNPLTLRDHDVEFWDYDPDRVHDAVIAIPLALPAGSSLRVGVLSLARRSADRLENASSGLLKLALAEQHCVERLFRVALHWFEGFSTRVMGA